MRTLTSRIRRGLTAVLAACAGMLALADPAGAIVIRHDRPDEAYQALAKEYPAAVGILPDGAGVLVAPNWVLTAAHVADGIRDRKPRIELEGKEIPITRVVLHPRWSGHGAHDIALLELAQPVADITPARLYEDDDELDQVVTFVGQGDFGDGKSGPQHMDRIRRGATNRVDRVDDDWLYFTFDEGEKATELEGVSGPGDSGGPALILVDEVTWTLGVSVFSMGDGQGPGRYGVREGYTRVSTHLKWLRSVLDGDPQPAAEDDPRDPKR